MKHWNRVPGEVVDAFSWETFKVRLVGLLSQLMEFKITLLIVRGRLDWMAFKCLFQPNYSMTFKRSYGI